MPLKAVAIALLVPPTALVFLALFGLVIGGWYRRIGRLMLWLSALGLLLLSLPVVGRGMLVALEGDLPLTPPRDQPPQAIVILSGDARRGPGIPFLHVGPLTLERLRTGALLERRTHLPVLLSGGRLHPSDPPLARVMADSLERDFQVPVKWLEPESRDTWQNAHMSAEILRAQGISSIYLVTHAWHMRRSVLAFAGTGITVTAVPTRFDRATTGLLVDFVPDVDGWRASYFGMHEWIGIAWYALRSWM